jgi:transcriptional regulator with XRE-family HTH domain
MIAYAIAGGSIFGREAMKRLRLNVKKVMQAKGVSIKELSELAGISQNTARGLYHEITERIDLPILDRVALALGVEPISLLRKNKIPSVSP